MYEEERATAVGSPLFFCIKSDGERRVDNGQWSFLQPPWLKHLLEGYISAP
jgi:hypothetical protein